MISEFRGYSLRAQEKELVRRLDTIYESDTWLPEWWDPVHQLDLQGCHVTREELWAQEEEFILSVVMPSQEREARLSVAEKQGSRLLSAEDFQMGCVDAFGHA